MKNEKKKKEGRGNQTHRNSVSYRVQVELWRTRRHLSSIVGNHRGRFFSSFLTNARRTLKDLITRKRRLRERRIDGGGRKWMGDRRRIKRERERKVGPTGRRLHDGIKSFVGINDNDDNEAACHRRVGRAIIVRRRISQSLLGNLFFATMFPFFSSDRQTISSSSSFFPSRKFRRKKKRKVSKDRRVSFLYKYFQGNFIPWFYALASDNAPRFEVWNDKFSTLNFRRERGKERECVFQLLTKLQLVNCLFRVSHRSRRSCGEGHRKERCKSVSRELRPLLNVVPRGQLSNPPFSTDSYPETFRQLSNRSIDPRSSSFLSLYRFLPSIVENFVTVPLSSRPSDPRSRARRINIHPRLGGIRGWHSR